MSHEIVAFENCVISFPSLCNDNDHDHDQDHSTALKYDNGVPVVILLGWAGCKQRHLKKYSAIYEK